MMKVNNSNNILTKLKKNERNKEGKEKLMLIGCRSLDPSPKCRLLLLLLQLFNGGLRESLKLSYESCASPRPDTFSLNEPLEKNFFDFLIRSKSANVNRSAPSTLN
uniref:Uncharacterized protein n=1 Tax=Opuntia streptacantha TaxID=393608 RepID=A0A7C9ACH8_OPUST